MSTASDRLLVQQIRQGDERAWEHLIARYEGRLFAFIHRRIKDQAACEDIVQDSFVGFYTSLPNYDDRRDLQTYLFTIASHKITDYLRRTGRHPLQQTADEGGELFLHKLAEQTAASSVARGQERRELESTAIARALTNLLDTWRKQGDYQRLKVLELLFVKGWHNKDVAKFLDISEQQVANIRFAAVKKLGELVRADGLPADVFPELHV
ncbi:MAG: sigma-70 family RNA polymerase sigma factor [Gemmataceae bacterium]|nr:sigma-70 family RNA polymerase sigma factor [Gemmataceae bacterium]